MVLACAIEVVSWYALLKVVVDGYTNVFQALSLMLVKSKTGVVRVLKHLDYERNPWHANHLFDAFL